MNPGQDYPGVTIIMICHDGQGNLLLNKRSQNCRDEQGKWDPGGGAVDFGDTIEQTLEKELLEEYCITPQAVEFLGFGNLLRELEGKPTHWVSLYFLIQVDRSAVKIGEPHKFDEIDWFKLDSLPAPLHSQFHIITDKFEKKIDKH